MRLSTRFPIIVIILSFLFFSSCSKDTTYTVIPDNPGNTNASFSDVTYGSNTNWLGQQQELKLDVYLPPSPTAGVKYPLIVWIHGGGFQVGDKAAGEKFADLMTVKGFIVAPINYRLGWTHSETNTCDGDTTKASEAYYRAVQDTRAALRFLVANADKYSIDTNWIFVGGASAGAVTSLGTAYTTQQVANEYLSSTTAKLGPVDAGNTLTNSYRIKGVLSMWGAVTHPEIITRANAIPTIFFQGTDDNVVPFDVGHFYICDNFQIGYGTKPLYEKLTGFDVPAVAHIEPGGGHGVFEDDFRADNSACFLKSLMSKTPQTGYYIGDNANNCQ
ncbi:hypothetical protein BH10BAC2_BH10BAC2_43630 [soil metagenome]